VSLPAASRLDLASDLAAGTSASRANLRSGFAQRKGRTADYATAPAADLADRPRSVSHAQAASLPLAALTAWQALTDHAGLQPGERVLVQGGAGGVGVYAVQLAAILGADVTANGRAGQGDFVRSLDARTFTEDARDVRDGFDVVVDTVGGPVLEASYGPGHTRQARRYCSCADGGVISRS
jgi:NADPH:quinone reductase-like Zn-dependent oxidoreductase